MDDGTIQKTDIKLDITAYPCGYVLNIGNSIVNIFGTSRSAYLQKIGRKKASIGTIESCHVFSTMKSMKKYVEGHEKALQFLHEHSGWNYSIEFTCKEFQQDMEIAHQPKSERMAEIELIEMLGRINSTVNKNPNKGIPADPTMDDIQEEVQFRMKALGLMKQIVKEYASTGRIYMSEFGGILYDVKQHGNIPYHVVVSHISIGDMYAVLYVSKTSNEWESERPNKGSIWAYVYNSTHPDCSEFGPIGVQSANGGIVRTD